MANWLHSMAAAPQELELSTYSRNKHAVCLQAVRTTNKTSKKYQSNVSAELHSLEKLVSGILPFYFCITHTRILSHGKINCTFFPFTNLGTRLFFPVLSPKFLALSLPLLCPATWTQPPRSTYIRISPTALFTTYLEGKKLFFQWSSPISCEQKQLNSSAELTAAPRNSLLLRKLNLL